MRKPSRVAELTTSVLLAFVALAPSGCLDGDKDEESPLPEDGKDDSLRKPTDHGPLEFGVPVVAAITAAEGFHAWTFELTGDARVDLTTTYAVRGQRKTDTVLYLYKAGPTGWGSYLARNDDHGGTVYSQLIRPLGAGRYRALVKGYSVSAVGKFQLTVGCEGAGCQPAASDACLFGETYGDLGGNPDLTTINHNVITAATLARLSAEDQIRLMVAVQQSSHSDVTTPLEALGRVDQGQVNVTWLVEPRAQRAFIAFEYGAGDNSYGAIFDRGSGAMVATIHDGDLLDCAVVAETCVLPEDYVALRSDARFALLEARVITAAEQLDAHGQAQVLATLRQVYGAELASIAAGLALADRHQVNVNQYRFNVTNADLTVVEFGAGDTSVGAIYFGTSLQVAGVIEDLFIGGCALFADRGQALAGGACRSQAGCAAGLLCAGVFAGAGVCVSTADLPGEGLACASDAACGAGLVCAGATRGDGLCNPAWQRGTFADDAGAAIPDGRALVRGLAVRGLATVDTDVILRATIAHPRASQVRVTLTNPAGAEAVVYTGVPAADGQPLVLNQAVPFAGDESVNGEWTLRVEDRTVGQTGTLTGWGLTITSRWD